MSRPSVSLVTLRDDIERIIKSRAGSLLSDQFCSALATAVVDGMQELAAGGTILVPSTNIALRNAQILAEFNGRNHREIYARYGIGARTLQRILRRGDILGG